jgi:hypothetical protein
MSKLNADINLGAGDQAPSRSMVLRAPNKDDGSPGDPIDLSGAAVRFVYQERGTTDEPTSIPVNIVGDPTLGQIRLDWPAPVPPGDYDCRFEVLLGTGPQMSFPDGPDVDGNEFYWLHVSAGFAS